MKSIPIVLKEFVEETFTTDLTITTVETISTGVYKLTYNCKLNTPYVWINSNPVFRVFHNADTYYYTVTAIGDCDFTVTSSGTVYIPVVGDTFRQVRPTFIHGTQKKAKAELDQLINNGLTYPLIYLQEIQSEKFTNDPLSSIISRPNCRIWFLLPNDENWTTDNHYDLAIEAMKNLATEFMRQIEYFGVTAPVETDPDTFELVYHAGIGTVNDTGHLKDLLNRPHSGCLMLTTLSIAYQSCCC